jgi:hypothetical protein
MTLLQIERHHRAGAGKSDHSWIKHGMLETVVGAQIAAFRQAFPRSRAVLIDGNAGDGHGVELSQFDLFDGCRHSLPTPQLLASMAQRYKATLLLCERSRKKRKILKSCFPNALIVSDHSDAVAYAISEGFNYVLWLSDPCGPGGHGEDAMRQVALHVVRSDFVIVSNEASLLRFKGVSHSPYWQKHQKYVSMLDPQWWLDQLSKRYLARSKLIKPSAGFHFRVLTLGNYLTDGVRRQRGVEVFQR